MIFYGMRNKSIVIKKKIDCNPQISKVNQWKRQEMLIIYQMIKSQVKKDLYREIYWEHEGMMDKQDYARAAVRKIELYQINHIYPSDRLIITFETEQNILNSKIIENLIEKYLL